MRKLIFKIFRVLERYLAFLQGKGYGAYSVDKEVKAVSTILTSCNVFIDVGANIGDYSQAILKEYPKAKIFAFEPCVKTAQKLALRFVDNSQSVVSG